MSERVRYVSEGAAYMASGRSKGEGGGRGMDELVKGEREANEVKCLSSE